MINRLANRTTLTTTLKGADIMQSDMNIRKILEENFQPALSVNTVEVPVEFSPSELFQEAAVVYALEAERVMRFTSNDNFIITSEEFSGYFTTLLYLRVSRVNSVKDNTTKLYIADLRNYNVPAFIHTLLSSIGKAIDYDFGFEFIPKVKIEASQLLGPEEMREISRKLGRLALEGLVCISTGVSVLPQGELATMATLSMSGDILSYRKDHPIYGFYASFFKHTLLSNVMSPNMLRIKYGSQQDYRMLVQHIV